MKGTIYRVDGAQEEAKLTSDFCIAALKLEIEFVKMNKESFEFTDEGNKITILITKKRLP